MTKLHYWYHTQSKEDKKTFREKITDECGISDETFYNYLKSEAPKLAKEKLAEYSNISINDLYKSII